MILQICEVANIHDQINFDKANLRYLWLMYISWSEFLV